MIKNPRFQVRDTELQLALLDKIIKELGYKNRSHWYNEMKRRTYLEHLEKVKTGK